MNTPADMVVKMLRADAHIESAMNGVPVEHTRQYQAAESIACEFVRLRAELAEMRAAKAERDTLLLDLSGVVSWYSRNHPWPSTHDDHPMNVAAMRLQAYAALSGGEEG